MAAQRALKRALVRLQITMKNGMPQNTAVDSGNGFSAVLNSWPERAHLNECPRRNTMSAHQNEKEQVTSGRRTLLNILLFMFGTIAVLVAIKFIFGM